MRRPYKFIYYCPKCDNIVFKSNQHLTDGEIICPKCDGRPLQFSKLVIKVIPLTEIKSPS